MAKLNNKWLISSINSTISNSQRVEATGINQLYAKITTNSFRKKGEEDECENTVISKDLTITNNF